MRSHAEFRWSYWRYCGRQTARISGIFGVGAVTFLGVWLIVGLVSPQEDPTVRSEAAMAFAVVVVLAAVGLTVRHAETDARLDPGLLCPWCNSPLGYLHGIIVLSSGNCPHCGERVLED